jgi:hypothetical protein
LEVAVVGWCKNDGCVLLGGGKIEEEKDGEEDE